MVKMSETIICQRFVQNAWKKDLCSNCFKSKEDHVMIPEGKVSYRWTSHVNNFPRHSIMKQRQNVNKEKPLAVSFQTNECEIIGVGGEPYSSDDEFYPPYDDNAVADADNEEGIEEFRKLTRTNTDFNSVPANLRIEEGPSLRKDGASSSDVKLGKPLVDANGRRQTIRVTVEPFRSSPLLSNNDAVKPSPNRTRSEENRSERTDHYAASPVTNENVAKLDKIGDNGRIMSHQSPPTLCRDIMDDAKNTKNRTNILKLKLNDGATDENRSSESSSSNIVVKVTNGEMATEKVRSPAPLSTTASCEQRAKSTEKHASPLADDEKRHRSPKKDSNPVCLPLIACKTMEIDLDKPSNATRSDSASRPRSPSSSTSSVECRRLKSISAEKSVCASPQPSFLHNFGKDRSKADALVGSPAKTSSRNTFVSENIPTTPTIPEITNTPPCLPKSQITNNNANSTKRQAPKPPFNHMSTTSVPMQNPETIDATSNLVYNKESFGQYEQQMDCGKNNARSRTLDQIMDYMSPRLNMGIDTPTHSKFGTLNARFLATGPGTNSLRRYVTLNPDATYRNCKFETFDSTSIYDDTHSSGKTRSAPKCSRSLSCDSIISPHIVSSSEKPRKYSSATVKVKSKIRKFLRFTDKDEEKSAVSVTTNPASRKRIEIIHPLDLNKSSVEILRSSTLPIVRPNDGEAPKNTECDNTFSNKKLSQPNINRSSCPANRPTKPPPPPRTQSLDQPLSEISKPVRPPPPKSLNNSKSSPFEKTNSQKETSNVYENIGDSRHGIAPAKPQRASSMRDRTRQLTSSPDTESNMQITAIPEYETVPECDQSLQHLSHSFETTPASSIVYCGSETESDICFYSITSQDSDFGKSGTNDDELNRRRRSVVYGSLEDNYGAVIIANHEALSHLLEQANEATIIPNSLKTLQTSDQSVLFEHLRLAYDSKISVYDWNIYNAVWADKNLVISISRNQFATTKSLPPYLTLYPLMKFTDTIPGNLLDNDSSNPIKTNAYVTIWNEERIQSIAKFCTNLGPNCSSTTNECDLLITQLTNALKHLQSCGIEDVSLDEIFVCKRDQDEVWRLVLLPFDTRFTSSSSKQNRFSLEQCIHHILKMLLPNAPITDIISKIFKDSKGSSIALINTVAEYLLWGPCEVNLQTDRQTSLQRWLDLEKAKFLHKIVCKPSSELNVCERWHLVFLVHTNPKILAEASHLFEKQTRLE